MVGTIRTRLAQLTIASLGVCASIAVPGTASGEEPVVVEVARASVIISDEEVGGRPLEFGTFLFDPTIEVPVSIPGTNEVVGVLEAERRVGRLDVVTGRLRIGDSVPNMTGFRSTPTITSDGQSVWVFTTDFDRNVQAHRYDLATLSLVATIELTPVLGANEEVFGAMAVSGRENSLVVNGRRMAFLIEDDSIAPNRVSEVFELYGINASNSDQAFASVAIDDLVTGPSEGIHTLDVDADGVVLGEQIIDETTAPRGFTVRDGEIVTFQNVYDFDGNTIRAATSFDRAADDPTEPLRYGYEYGDVPVVVYDEISGDAITDPRPCRLDTQLELIGNGRAAARGASGGTLVLDILDACGSYGEFTPVEPARVLDTRTGQGLEGTPTRINAGETVRVRIHGLADVPEDGVESVVLNVTALRQRGVGSGKNFVTVWPAGFDRPSVSNINIGEREVVGNMVTVSTAADGFVDIYSNSGTVDLTVDVMGYFASATAPAAARFQNIDNVRLLDTRETGARLGSGRSLTVDASRSAAVQSVVSDEVVALVVNVTAVQPTTRSHFRIFPSGSPLPDASSANFEAQRNTNRLVTVKSAGGAIDIWNSEGDTHLTVDLVGVYVVGDGIQAPQGGRFVGVVPFRELDTRSQSPFDGDGSIREDSLISMPGWRPNIDLVTNLTSIRPTATGYLSSGPWTGDFEPFLRTSALNFGPGAVVANQSIIRTSGDGEIGIFNGVGRTHVAVDVFGFYTP